MSRPGPQSSDALALSYLVAIAQEIAEKQTSQSATPSDLAVGRASVGLLVAIANQVEDHLRGTLSDRHVRAIAWVRQTCAWYESLFWQTAPEFSRP